MSQEHSENIGKEIFFKELYFKYFNRVRYYAYCYLRDMYDAENVAQDVYVSFWEKFDELHVSGEPVYLLLLMAKWRCLNIMRRDKRDKLYKNSSVKHDGDSIRYLALSDESSVRLQCKEIYRLYDLALSEMPPKTRETFLMSRNNDLKYKEIASLLNVSQKTVEYRIMSAFRVLRKYLGEYIRLIVLFL